MSITATSLTHDERAEVKQPFAIDPVGCSCARCASGHHIPLDQATRDQRLAMVSGPVADRTGLSFLELYAWERENHPKEAAAELVPA